MTSDQNCEVMHQLIAQGTCPWCELELKSNEVALSVISRSGKCFWNVNALEAALDHNDIEVRLTTVSTIALDAGPSLETAVALLGKASNDPIEHIRWLAENEISHLGREMTASEAETFEARSRETPQDLAIRILLLTYYFAIQQESIATQQARMRHVVWLIENAPESTTAGSPVASVLRRSDPESYEVAQRIWRKQVARHADQPRVLGNAAAFFTLNDPVESESLLQQAKSLEPENPEWPKRLAHLYSLQVGRSQGEDRNFADLALDAYQEAETKRQHAPLDPLLTMASEEIDVEEMTKSLERIHSLCELAKAAVKAKQFDVVEDYAQELLSLATSDKLPEYFRDDGNAIFYSHFALGMSAIHRGDLAQAKEHLLASGRTSGSPTLGSFGPNMSLAKALLEHGEQSVVLVFFDSCGQFWKDHQDTLGEWSEVVQRGEIPDFGPNLNY
ncbi:hypothetical protein DTL21_12520 [Bremerella cremea]|uniref:Uncharacterized protein n=1 Tax=Blastopirellula marina TaxID=124 RepID=A0A2S8FQ78_9BACT|nr:MULTISPECIES: hypothetical protein [Pirellulaceae]PQO34346.1 hypothetical protein C5Y83_12515 [Blastopirellula marina]RCS46842.1 hypothetical protein DTL21_12520 [Bremerella cremea]